MRRYALAILWSSFLVAIIAEGFLFSLFDPHELRLTGRQLELSPLAAYTIGFFIWWVFCALASTLSCYLTHRPHDQTNSS